MRSKRFLLAVLLMMTVLTCGLSLGETVTVSSYAQLLAAVNDTGADTVLLAPDYVHGSERIGESLHPEGSVTIAPAGEGERTVTGRFDVSAGTVVFQRLNLTGSVDSPALSITGSACVTALDVRGGSSSKGIGRAGAEIIGSGSLAVRNAAGGDGKTMGGDGIYAIGACSVTAASAAGGSSSDGYGGCGVAALGCNVRIDGEAKGGSGALSGGLAIQYGSDAEVSAVTSTDGAKTSDRSIPGQPKSYADLLYAIRLGQKDITLAAGYKHGAAPVLEQPWFLYGDSRISIAASGKKKALFSSGISLCGGTAVLRSISIEAPQDAVCLTLSGEASLTLSGSLKASGQGAAVCAQELAKADISGDITGACILAGSSHLLITGNVKRISAKHPACVLVCDDAALEITGNLTGFSKVMHSGTLQVKGSLTGAAGVNALCAEGDAHVSISGNVNDNATSAPAVAASDRAVISIGGSVTASRKTNAILARDDCRITVGGNVSGGTNQPSLPAIWQQGRLVSVSGTVSGAVVVESDP